MSQPPPQQSQPQPQKQTRSSQPSPSLYSQILPHYSNIIELKKNQAKIELLMSVADSQLERQEIQSMRLSLEDSLKEEMTLLRQKEKDGLANVTYNTHTTSQTNYGVLSVELLKADDVNKLAKCYVGDAEADQADNDNDGTKRKRWLNGEILEVDSQNQIARVQLYGKNHTSTEISLQQSSQRTLSLPAYYLKVLKQPDSSLFRVGTLCKCIFSRDGQFYPCTIEAILEPDHLYKVKYRKYNTEQVVVLHRLRAIQNHNAEGGKGGGSNTNEQSKDLIIPQKYKILPNDTEATKKAKKSKVKALKFEFKNRQLEEISREKQSKWKEWNTGGTGGYFKTKKEVEVLAKKWDQPK